MTPSERERRGYPLVTHSGDDDWKLTYEDVKPHSLCCDDCKAQRERAERAEARHLRELQTPTIQHAQGRAERAEAAARDFALALRVLSTPPGVVSSCVVSFAADALGRHPSFSGEEGTGP